MSWALQAPPLNEGEDEYELKLRYAAIIAANPNNYMNAGYKLFPGIENAGRAMQCRAWLSDPIVQTEIERLGESGEVESVLPSKEQVAKEILDTARATNVTKDRLDGFKLFGEFMGHISKGPAIVNDNRVVNVLRVPTRDVTPEDDADFDTKFHAQQTRLIADARSNRPTA